MEQTHFYYLRDKQNHPLVTVCLHKTDGTICRGIAICSPKDNPNKKTGKAISLGRAKQAMKNKIARGSVIREEAYNVLDKTSCDLDFFFAKSTNQPILTKFEVKLLYRGI